MEVQSPDPQYADQLQGKFRANDKKFICNYLPDCKAAFSRQEHLQRHIRKHTGERPFSCPCGRTFTRLDNLRQHAQTVHSGTEMAKISEEQNAIAAATKLRPTPNSPPPPRRLAGEGSDTDPYPRPVTKVAKVKAARVKSESPVPPTAINSAASSPAAAAAAAAAVAAASSSSMVPVTPAASAASAATPPSIRAQVGVNPYDGLTFMHTPLDTTTATTNHHHQHPAYESPHHTPYSTPTQNYTTFPGLPHYGNANHYMPHHHHHHQQQQQSQQQQQAQQQRQQQQQQPDVESSVGSQPISSLVKRRAPKNDFVYTGGHMLNSPGLTIHSGSTDFDFTRSTSDTTPDEGEQMSEYINNGLEPKISTTTAVVATTTAATTATEAVPSTTTSTTTTTSRDIGSHGDVPGILLHFACQNPDL